MPAAVALALALAGGLLVAPAVDSTAGAPARADSVSDRKRQIDRELDQIREDLEGTAKELVEATVALRRSQMELVDARAALANAQAALAEARRRDEALAARLAFAKAEEAKAGRDLAENKLREQETRATLGEIAREAYLTGGMSGLSVALEADSPEQFTQRMVVAGTALRVQNGAIARLDVQQAESRARSAKLEALRAKVAELKKQSEALVRARVAAEAAARAAQNAVEVLVGQQTRALTVIEARKAAEQARLNSLAKEQAKLRAILAARARAARARGSASTVRGDGVLAYPVNGPVTSPFGYRIHPIFHTRRLHTGTDFGVGCGTPVRASAAGTIIMAGWAGAYGNRIVIDHGNVRGVGLASTYNHLTSFVRAGGRVSRGQVIAYSGTTGTLSTGCHLHFEVLVNGGYVNPMSWL